MMMGACYIGGCGVHFKNVSCILEESGVVLWLVNVAVSEMILMRMRICGQLANIINPIHTKYSLYERTFHRLSTEDRRKTAAVISQIQLRCLYINHANNLSYCSALYWTTIYGLSSWLPRIQRSGTRL